MEIASIIKQNVELFLVFLVFRIVCGSRKKEKTKYICIEIVHDDKLLVYYHSRRARATRARLVINVSRIINNNNNHKE